ncbi:TerD domain-containing protein [Streptomyces sp. NBC_01275]|uniref:TerD family protein n=1 Tax=Streptomyces sp. NBC_01275 TaxID=2903807 RepID=UPI002255B074|nr:TerD family protein [Streptomyces sp. NBC_01275]MCX4766899.1 TerD domain-containing protein [Streptomyces sp. NBC_01275]
MGDRAGVGDMPELGKGGNTALGTGPVTVELFAEGDAVDLSALLVTAEGRVGSDDDLVFYNQPGAESDAVRHRPADAEGPERIEVDPAALSADVDRVVLVASCDPDDAARTFREVKNAQVRAVQAGAEAVVFRLPPLTDGERAVLLSELYRRGETWKLRAIGQGYADGLAGLATDFGIDVAEAEPEPEAEPEGEAGAGETPEQRTPTVPGAAPVPPAPVSPAPPRPPVSPPPPTPPGLLKPPLGKVSLDKGSQVSLSLDKADRALVVTVSLEWDGGSDRRRKAGADLDLYALFVPAAKALRGPDVPGTVVRKGHVPQGEPLRPGAEPPAVDAPEKAKRKRRKDNGQDAVYYKRLGSLTDRPHIRLDGDSRVPGREVVRIARPDEQGYVLLCAYSAVSNGAGSFHSFGAKVVVDDGRGSTVTVPLYDDTSTRYWVAIALVDFTSADGAAIHHIEAYSARMTERRPVLHADGTIEMNKGPVEFKRR